MDILLSTLIGLFTYSYLNDISNKNIKGGGENDAKIYPTHFQNTECVKLLELYDMMYEDNLLDMAESKNIIDIYIQILKLIDKLVNKVEPCQEVLKKYTDEPINPRKIINKLFNYGDINIPGSVGYRHQLNRLLSSMTDELDGDRQLRYTEVNDEVMYCLEEKAKNACDPK